MAFEEPVNKPILISGEVKGRRYKVYHSGLFQGSFTSSDTRVVINDKDITNHLVTRGWYDLDAEEECRK